MCELAEENLQKQAQQEELWCHSLPRSLGEPAVCDEGGKCDLSLSHLSLAPSLLLLSGDYLSLLSGEPDFIFKYVFIFLSIFLGCLLSVFCSIKAAKFVSL